MLPSRNEGRAIELIPNAFSKSLANRPSSSTLMLDAQRSDSIKNGNRVGIIFLKHISIPEITPDFNLSPKSSINGSRKMLNSESGEILQHIFSFT